jgi:D-alanyl-D-alanine carboxypeptidase/D-alanyl-D-alanine-endopeptidase (penicillin-binding protein 4)
MPLKRTLLTLIASIAFSLPVHASSLEARLNDLLNNPQLKSASVSLDIVEVTPVAPGGAGGGAKPLFSHNRTTPLGPASNCKLLTTAAAFDRYGPKAAFKTQLYQLGDDLILLGGGDPALGDAKLAASRNESSTAPFEQWADLLKQRGISRYRNLLVDDRVFDHQFTHPNWPADQRLDWYSAPIAGLNFNANCLDWTPKLTPKGIAVEITPDTSYVDITIKATRGKETRVSLLRPANSAKFELRGTLAASATSPYSVPIDDPSLWTATILRDTLARAGIISTGQVARIDQAATLTGASLLASHDTPILDVISRANTNSLNMMAEALCKRLGYDASKGKEPGSWSNGTAAVESFVASLGVNPAEFTLDDGSGLSNKNRVSSRAFTTVLAHVAARPDGPLFINTLAVPGEDGTLQHRFKGLSVADHIHAKTGHISGVSTLSGYILMGDSPAAGRIFAFSILCNKYQGNVNPWQDDVCQAVFDWARGK